MTTPVKIFFRIGLALLGLGFVVGSGGVGWGVLREFYRSTDPNATQPEVLGSGLVLALGSCVVGIPIVTVGFLVTVVSLVVHFATKPRSKISAE